MRYYHPIAIPKPKHSILRPIKTNMQSTRREVNNSNTFMSSAFKGVSIVDHHEDKWCVSQYCKKVANKNDKPEIVTVRYDVLIEEFIEDDSGVLGRLSRYLPVSTKRHLNRRCRNRQYSMADPTHDVREIKTVEDEDDKNKFRVDLYDQDGKILDQLQGCHDQVKMIRDEHGVVVARETISGYLMIREEFNNSVVSRRGYYYLRTPIDCLPCYIVDYDYKGDESFSYVYQDRSLPRNLLKEIDALEPRYQKKRRTTFKGMTYDIIKIE